MIPDKEKLRSSRELEDEFEKGEISENSYNSRKKQLADELETAKIINRVKRLQGKKEVDGRRTIDKRKQLNDQKEKEELMRKYMTSTKIHKLGSSNGKKRRKNRTVPIIGVLLALIFFSGIALGFLVYNGPSQTSVAMTVNQSAFPNNSSNITNATNNNSLSSTTNQTSQSAVVTNSNTGTSSDSNSTGSNSGYTPTSTSSSSSGSNTPTTGSSGSSGSGNSTGQSN